MSAPAGILLLMLLFIASGCAGPGVTHTVKRGETLWRICRTYGVDMQEVAELNDIRNPAEIKAGKKIFIPGASSVRKVQPYTPPRGGYESKYEGSDKIDVQKGRFDWPVKGPLSSQFGLRDGVRHDGIDIRAPEGTPIKAAEKGRVVFVESSMRGYGRIIILEHEGDYFTVYAHNKENHVKRGDTVSKGDVIGAVGNSGNADGSHLHFEVRQGKKVRNPLFFLP